MHLVFLFLLMAAPFWEAKEPKEWTPQELAMLLTDSPWAQPAQAARPGAGIVPVQVYLASPRPMRDAELEWRRRTFGSEPQTYAEHDYQEFLRENLATHIVLAVRITNPDVLADAEESRRMEEESYLKVGRKRLKMTGHFPPSETDPFLRLIFPREIPPNERKITFELYLPSVAAPYRQVEFSLKPMVYRGKVEY
ncbi:MAG: hypothetical protein ACK5AZ_05220 [Bryobacteraceae bacterium]